MTVLAALNVPDTQPLLQVGTGPRGRGVFARRALAAGTVIERCPVILIPRGEIGHGVLSHYVFLWGGEHGAHYALPTGSGLLFNHDPGHNADFRCDEAAGCVEFFTIAAIAAGYALWTIYGAGAEAVSWGFALLLAGLPVYFVMRRSRVTAQSQ